MDDGKIHCELRAKIFWNQSDDKFMQLSKIKLFCKVRNRTKT
jgi:hypothetical protein